MMRLALFIFLFAFIFPLQGQAADTMEIYVHNILLHGEILRQGTEIYVPAVELRKLIRENLSWDDGTGIITIDGKATSLRLIRHNSNLFLPLRATSQLLGYEVAYNEITGILDVYRKTSHKPDAKPADVTPETPASKPVSQDRTTEKKDLLTIQEKIVLQDSIGTPEGTPMVNSPAAGLHTSQTSATTDLGLRITAVVTNGRATDARNVIATCILKTQDGEVYTKDERAVGTIKAGEKTEVLFYFPAAGGGIVLQRSFTVKGD